jgi:hypothetical protein
LADHRRKIHSFLLGQHFFPEKLLGEIAIQKPIFCVGRNIQEIPKGFFGQYSVRKNTPPRIFHHLIFLRHWIFSMAHFWRGCFAPPLEIAYS